MCKWASYEVDVKDRGDGTKTIYIIFFFLKIFHMVSTRNNAKTNHESWWRGVAKAYGRKDGKIQLKQMRMHGSKKSKLSKKNSLLCLSRLFSSSANRESRALEKLSSGHSSAVSPPRLPPHFRRFRRLLLLCLFLTLL